MDRVPMSLAPTWRRVPLFCLASLAVACTDVDLERLPEPAAPPYDNRLSISGNFCTQDPLAVEFPLKILFVVDVSDSMSQTDPPVPSDNNYTGRARAVVDVIQALAGRRGVEIGIVTFQSAVNDLTRGFRPNYTAEEVAALIEDASRLNAEAGQTNYEGALDTAFEVLANDLAQADALIRARSRYAVIFISDGLPNPIEPPTNTPESIRERVESIQNLERERRLVELKLHTVYLSGRTPPQFQQEPLELLQSMAETGKGTFRNVGNGEAINFLSLGFTSFRRVFALKNFMVRNRNARPHPRFFEGTDSDGDGLADSEEELVGTDPVLADTDGDGFDDALEDRLKNAGFDPLDAADADCRTTPEDDYNRRDDDGDGLRNCEERFLGTNPRLFDTDRDGVPDPFEVRGRVSPVADDFFADPDRDGATNGAELRDGTDPTLDDRELAPFIRYEYALDMTEIRDSRSCYRFRVADIALMPSRPDARGILGVNRIDVVYGEVPADANEDFGDFHVACVHARFLEADNVKLPANGQVTLTETDFKNPSVPGAFDPERDCVGVDLTVPAAGP